MNARRRVIPYPEERALEDAAYARGIAPTRIFALLLPIWCVEVRANVTDAEDYQLIDRYLERGIAEGGLDTAGELAEFFTLDQVLVDRALRFLAAIGHVTDTGGRLALTDLGRRSVRDRVRYVVTRQDRRKMYFDAFGSRPLTRPYYESRTVTMLSGGALQEVVNRQEWPRFQMLAATRGFRREALAALADESRRDHYNLPERIDQPQSLGEECVYLPLYLVRGVQRGERGGRVRYLAYGQTGAQADEDLTAICEKTPEVGILLENEETVATGRDETRVHDWLHRRGLRGCDPVRLENGTLRVTFPGSVFGTNGALSINKLGSYVVLDNDFFHVWCGDERVRRRALLERADFFLSARRGLDPAAAAEMIRQITRQLELWTVDLRTLRGMAVKAGRRRLATQLDQLT